VKKTRGLLIAEEYFMNRGLGAGKAQLPIRNYSAHKEIVPVDELFSKCETQEKNLVSYRLETFTFGLLLKNNWTESTLLLDYISNKNE
jgi:hypothetical protein